MLARPCGRGEKYMVRVFIDNNVWDLFYQFALDLNSELPTKEFDLLITREAEFEIKGMPEEKKKYVVYQLNNRNIKTDKIFGFSRYGIPPSEQRFSGFSTYANKIVGGRFITDDELKLIKEERNALGSKKKNGLYNNEADIAIASRSLNSIVLTCDNKKVLRRAKNRKGSMVINLIEFDNTIPIKQVISEFMKKKDG